MWRQSCLPKNQNLKNLKRRKEGLHMSDNFSHKWEIIQGNALKLLGR